MALEFKNPDEEDDEIGGPDERESEQGQPVSGDDGEGEGADETNELDEDQEKEEIDAQPAKPSRAQSRIQSLANEAREARERAERVEREFNEFKTRASQPAPEKEKEPTAEEMSLWPADQIVQYRLDKAEKRNQEQINQLRFQTLEQGDKTAWNGFCATDARAKKMAADVETRLQEYRNKGMWYWSRSDVYEKLIGERVARQGARAVETQRQQGRQRIERQRAPAGSPSGDQPRGRNQLNPQQERDKRLKESGFFSDS